MKIIKLAAVVMAAIMFIMAAGCAAETAVTDPMPEPPAPTASATQAPTPEPKKGIEAEFDKPITIAVISNADEAASALFFDAVVREAEGMGVTVTTHAAGAGFDAAVAQADDADALIAYLPDTKSGYGALETAGKPAAVFEMEKGNVPPGVSHFYYEPAMELDMAFDAALTYPPHDTPVRLILMFESTETPAYAAYQALYEKGMIFPKELYLASKTERGPKEWLTNVLGDYVEGMLDAVFAENTALAVSAFDALDALERTDMEVFCPGMTPDVVTRMHKEPEVFAQAIGVNDALAGMLSVRAVLNMLKGEGAVSQAFETVLINAADLGEDAVAALMAADSEKAALYNAGWMDALRAYYRAEDVSGGE